MTVYIANVDTQNDSFGQWIEKTNYLIQALSNVVVTTTSNTTVGNASITGDFYANNIHSSNGGFLYIGKSTSNSVISANTIVIQSSSTSNVVVSSNGLVIDGLTAYTKSFMTIGNTTISGANISVDDFRVNHSLVVGNTTISNTQIYTDHINTFTSYVYANSTIGDSQANTFIDRYGITIAQNPLGSYVINSYMTATDLWITNIHANSINLLGSQTIFPSNTYFYGANVYLQKGVVTSGNSWVGGTHLVITANTTFLGTNNEFVFDYNLVIANNITAYGHISANSGMYTRDFVTFYGMNSGSTTLKANNDAGSATFTLPAADGNLHDVLTTNGSGKLYFSPPFTGNNQSDFVIRDLTARSVGVGTGASGSPGDIRAIGNITAYYSSDQRLKENVKNITDALTKIQSINGVEFDWTDAYITQHGGLDNTFMRKHDVGVIAQEIEAIMPDIVVQRSDGYKAVKYEKIIPLLIEAIKQLKAEVDSLKNGN